MKATEILDQIDHEEIIDYITNNSYLKDAILWKVASTDEDNKLLQTFVKNGEYLFSDLTDLIKTIHFEQFDVDQAVKSLLPHCELDLKNIFREMTKYDSSWNISDKVVECIGLSDGDYLKTESNKKRAENITKDLINDIAVHFGIFETLENLKLNKDELLRAIQIVLEVNRYHTKEDLKQLIDEL